MSITFIADFCNCRIKEFLIRNSFISILLFCIISTVSAQLSTNDATLKGGLKYPYKFQFNGNPVSRMHSAADPDAHVWDNELWVYCSQDRNVDSTKHKHHYDAMDGYHLFSTKDLKNWTDHGQIFHSSNVPWAWDKGGFLWAPGAARKNGDLVDIVLGKDSFEDYLDNPAYMGCIVGRVANRIKNGRFSLNGKEYQLALNDGENHNHGGITGFDKVVWDSESFENEADCGVVLSYLSPDGEENYPGNLHVTVKYTFTNKNELIIHYQAETDKPTLINLTNHSYFNLKGEVNGNVLDTFLKINSFEYTETDNDFIPTGKIWQVLNTAYDFSAFKQIGKHISACKKGYNINFILEKSGDITIPAAIAVDEESGRTLEVFTTEPGLQLYTAGYMSNEKGKNGNCYDAFAGFCLETQHFADAPNHSHFPTIVLNPSEKYESKTIYSLGLISQNNTPKV